METPAGTFQYIFKFLFRISLQIAFVLSLLTVGLSSSSAISFALYFLTRCSISSTTSIGSLGRHVGPPTRWTLQNVHLWWQLLLVIMDISLFDFLSHLTALFLKYLSTFKRCLAGHGSSLGFFMNFVFGFFLTSPLLSRYAMPSISE